MKPQLYYVVLLLFFSGASFAQQTTKEAKAQKKESQYQEALTLIGSKKFEYIGQRVLPLRGRPIDLTTRSNFLRINGNQAEADMPYFGRAYSGGYSPNDGGIKFDAEMKEYEFLPNDKKHKLMVRFVVKDKNENYTCTLNLSSLSSATLSVISSNKQSISYTGSIQALQMK